MEASRTELVAGDYPSTIRAWVVDSEGVEVPGHTFTWSSSDTTVARVGRMENDVRLWVWPLRHGDPVITARSGNLVGSVTLRVDSLFGPYVNAWASLLEPDGRGPGIGNLKDTFHPAVRVQGSAGDARGVARVTVSVGGGPEQELDITPGIRVDFADTLALQPGLNQVQVYTYDRDGRRRSAQPFSVTRVMVRLSYDFTASTHTILDVNGGWTASKQCRIRGTVEGATRLDYRFIQYNPTHPSPTYSIPLPAGTGVNEFEVQDAVGCSGQMVELAARDSLGNTFPLIQYQLWAARLPRLEVSPRQDSLRVAPGTSEIELNVRVYTVPEVKDQQIERVTVQVGDGLAEEVAAQPGRDVSFPWRVPLSGSVTWLTVSATSDLGWSTSETFPVVETTGP